MPTALDERSGLLAGGLVNPYRQDPAPSRRRGRRAVSGAGVAVTAAAAVVGGLGATAAHAGTNAEIGADIVRAATDASLNDGAVGGVVLRELRPTLECAPRDELAAVGGYARQLVAAAGGRPGLVQLAKDMRARVTSACPSNTGGHPVNEGNRPSNQIDSGGPFYGEVSEGASGSYTPPDTTNSPTGGNAAAFCNHLALLAAMGHVSPASLDDQC